jgi:hypothetical protein
MEENTEVSLEESEPLACLQYGFAFSLIALVLATIYFAFSLEYPTSVAWGALLAASLPSWVMGLLMRQRAWNQLGRDETAFALAAGGFMIVFFYFPFSSLGIMHLLGHLFSSYVTYLGFTMVPLVVWGCYMLLEAQTLKWLTNSCGIDPKYSWMSSVAGLVTWTLTYLGLCIFPRVTDSLRLLYRRYYCDPPLLSFSFVLAFLCAAPLFR